MKIAYLDCFSGISGDMCLGALLDAGVPLKTLLRELKRIPLKGYEIRVSKVKRAGIAATKVDVIQTAHSIERRAKSKYINPPLEKGGAEGFKQEPKRWKDIERIIENSSLSKEVKEKGHRVFRRLFEAEAKIHGEGFSKIHLHELSAVDCLIDVFGTVIGLDILEVEKIYSSAVNLGNGLARTKHGILPVPAPASAEILKGVPVYSTDIDFELTTPTGAVLVRELSSEFGNLPLMNIETIGIGAGSRNFKDTPNVLRLLVGQVGAEALSHENATVIETNIDDMNPQVYEYTMEKLFKKGALDVFLTQVIMKKGRPGIKLTVLCQETKKEELMNIIMRETTTIGLRFYDVGRKVLKREIKVVNTEFGKVRVKFARVGDEILKATPEYEDCKRIAKKLNIPLLEIMRRISCR